MEEVFSTWMFPVLITIGLFFLFAFLAEDSRKVSRRMKTAGMRPKMVKTEDCIEVSHMLNDYIHEVMDDDARQYNECDLAGCSGHNVMRNSKDIRSLVVFAHMAGGRLVVRRVSDEDIEDKKHTPLKVKMLLSDLDIARARSVDAKYKRRR